MVDIFLNILYICIFLSIVGCAFSQSIDKMARKIPDRWLNYTSVGRVIQGTRFIAFKVPLREEISQLSENNPLDGNILLERVPNLGMIIDLTNTNRYYSPSFFEENGIKHKKLKVPGHHVPPFHLVKKFKYFVSDFLRENEHNDRIIGVHCTHGVNRTGFFICNYMISRMNMDPDEAIKRFDIARGHQIERINYLDALRCLPSKLNFRREMSNSDHNDNLPSTSVVVAGSTSPIDQERDPKHNNWRSSQRSREDMARERDEVASKTRRMSRDDFEKRDNSRNRHNSNDKEFRSSRNNSRDRTQDKDEKGASNYLSWRRRDKSDSRTENNRYGENRRRYEDSRNRYEGSRRRYEDNRSRYDDSRSRNNRREIPSSTAYSSFNNRRTTQDRNRYTYHRPRTPTPPPASLPRGETRSNSQNRSARNADGNRSNSPDALPSRSFINNRYANVEKELYR